MVSQVTVSVVLDAFFVKSILFSKWKCQLTVDSPWKKHVDYSLPIPGKKNPHPSPIRLCKGLFKPLRTTKQFPSVFAVLVNVAALTSDFPNL